MSGFSRLSEGRSDAALNASFTEAVQRDNKHVGTRTFVWMGKAWALSRSGTTK